MKKITVTVTTLAIIASLGANHMLAEAKTYKNLNSVKVSSSITIEKGQAKQIRVSGIPKKAKIQYTSLNVKVAKVAKNGKVMGVSAGTTTVKVKVTYNKKNKTKKCKIVVQDASSTQAPGNTQVPNTTPIANTSAQPQATNTVGMTTQPSASNQPTTSAVPITTGTPTTSTAPTTTGTPASSNQPGTSTPTVSDNPNPNGTQAPTDNTGDSKSASQEFAYSDSMTQFAYHVYYTDGTYGDISLLIQELKDYYNEKITQLNYTRVLHDGEGQVVSSETLPATVSRDSLLGATITTGEVKMKVVINSIIGLKGTATISTDAENVERLSF